MQKDAIQVKPAGKLEQRGYRRDDSRNERRHNNRQ